MVERYLQGRLTPDEAQAFEEAYLSDPALLDELQLTDRLREGIRDAAAAGELGEPASAATASARASRWRATFGSVPYAAAATVLLGVSLVFSAALLVENRGLEQASGPESRAAPTRLLPLVSVRGDAANRLEAPPAGEWAVLLVDAGFTDYDDYRATLTRSAGGEVAALEGLSPSYDGRVGLGVPGSALTPGDYELRLEGRSGDGEFEQVSRIPLTITAPSGAQ